MTCPCACHAGPAAFPPPCDVDGGCGPHEDTTPTCAAVGCRRPPDPVICAVDARRLGDMLADIATLYPALDAAPSMQGREPGTGGGGGLKSERSVGDHAVMALRDSRTAQDGGLLSVLSVLAGWADEVRTIRKIVPPPRRVVARIHGHVGPVCDTWCAHPSCVAATWRYRAPFVATVASERGLLVAQLTWITSQDWAGAFHDEIRELWILLDRAVHGRRPATAKRACPECGGIVTVVAGVAACGGCEATWQGLDMARLGQEAA